MALILVVEDEEEVRDFIRFVLEKNHLIIEAAGSQAALNLIQKVRPNLAILDILLEGSEKTGAELRTILSTTFPAMPILAISAYANLQQTSEMLGTGKADFLAKPFTIGQLEIVVSELLEAGGGALMGTLLLAGEEEIVEAVKGAINTGRTRTIYRALRRALDEVRDDKTI